MSAAALLRAHPPGGYVPLVDLPLELGADPACGLRDDSPGVAPRHATLSFARGTYLLSAADGVRFEAGGGPAAMLALRDGDEVRLAAAAVPWRFRARPELGVAPLLGAGPESRIVTLRGTRCVQKRLPASRRPGEAERHLRLLAALGGAPHPALACVADGGACATDGTPMRWIVTHWVAGTSARTVVEEGGMAPARVLGALGVLAAGLAHLHARGVVHRDVAPGNVILTRRGGAALIDFGHAALAGDVPTSSPGVVGTPGYVAPEEVLAGAARALPPQDVYGLGAVGYALLTGSPPAHGEDVLDALARAACRAPALAEMGVAAPPALERAVHAALDPEPYRRPSAAAIARSLITAGHHAGLGGSA